MHFCIVCIMLSNTKMYSQEKTMVIMLQDGSEVPVFKQIRNQIVMGISDGRLQPGEKLPTVNAYH